MSIGRAIACVIRRERRHSVDSGGNAVMLTDVHGAATLERPARDAKRTKDQEINALPRPSDKPPCNPVPIKPYNPAMPALLGCTTRRLWSTTHHTALQPCPSVPVLFPGFGLAVPESGCVSAACGLSFRVCRDKLGSYPEITSHVQLYPTLISWLPHARFQFSGPRARCGRLFFRAGQGTRGGGGGGGGDTTSYEQESP